jgi:hypothetical protein
MTDDDPKPAVKREPTVLGVGREPTMVGVAPPAQRPVRMREPTMVGVAPPAQPPVRAREPTIVGVAPPAVEPPPPPPEIARTKEPSVVVPAGVPRSGGGWKVLLVFALGIGGGLAYLNRHRIEAELSPSQAEMPTPDVVTLTAPRAKPADERRAVEVLPSVSASSSAAPPKDAGATAKDAGAAKKR